MRASLLHLLAAVSCGLLAPATVTAQVRLLPLDIRVPLAPAAVSNDGRTSFAYELRILNVGGRGYALKRIEVTAGSDTLAVFEGDTLRSMTRGSSDTGDGRKIGAGQQTLVFLFVSSTRTPAVLTHRIFVTHPDSLDGAATDTLAAYPVVVDARAPIVLRAPLTGGPWLAANGPSNVSGHRRAVLPLDGLARIAQRYATDWVKYGADGRFWQGDSTRNANWYGYNAPVLAVASGTVAAIKDGIPENVALAPNRAVPITLETIGGNHVILDLGEGRYAFYAHLIPGSLTVKVGDRVAAGAVLGRLGNSGNSDAPHLHFHVGDRNAPLGAEGLAFAFDQFDQLGDSKGFVPGAWLPVGAPRPRRRELPFENQVVRFRP